MTDIVAAAIGLPPTEAIDFLRQKLAVPSEHWTDVWKQAHARSFMVAGAASQALVEDFHQAVTRAIAEGRTLADFRKDFDAIVEKHGWVQKHEPGWRANIIYETNLSMAYAAGRYAQMTEPGTLAVFPYWQYVHSGSRHPRVQHLAWNGLTLRANDPWWDSHYPPNGWHCGCRVRPLMRHELARMGKDGPDTAPEIQTRPWTNKHTGEVHQVPIGIDPGFDYNVGKAWKGPTPHTPAEAHLPPPAPLPAAPVATPPPPAHRSLLPVQSAADVALADTAMRDRFAEVANGLTEDQRTVLQLYQGSTFGTINKALRKEIETDQAIASLIDVLDSVMAAAPALQATTVFRGLHGPPADKMRELTVGMSYVEDGFGSSSLALGVAERFAHDDGVLFEIRLPEGYRGAFYMPAWQEFGEPELELLLQRGLEFTVVSNDGRHIVLEPKQ